MTANELHLAINAAARDHSAGRFPEAETQYRKILASRPNDVDALHLLGTLCAQTNRRPEGIELMSRACAISPNVAVIHNNLGTALRSSGQIDRAIATYRRAISLEPDLFGPYNDLGVALRMQGRLAESLAAQLKAVQLKPNSGDVWANLALVRADLGDFPQALSDCRKAIELDPAHARAHLNLAILYLQRGDFERGWPEYEWRWKCIDLQQKKLPPGPQWDGSDLHGKTILLHADQGYGDTLQFIRYAPMVARRGGRVILECQPILHRLLQHFPGVERAIPAGTPLPSYDLHCPLMSLPARCGTTATTIPAVAPYLSADAILVEHWRQKVISAAGGTLKIGIAWAGKPIHENDRNRSMPLANFAALASPGVTFFSLQKGQPASSQTAPPPGMRLIDFSNEWTDFCDTAALVANLDRVISVDTSGVHLAGAMGKPVWTLLPFNPDFRWLLHRDDSPWYPTMRLFRQRTPGGWEEVIQRVKEALVQSM